MEPESCKPFLNSFEGIFSNKQHIVFKIMKKVWLNSYQKEPITISSGSDSEEITVVKKEPPSNSVALSSDNEIYIVNGLSGDEDLHISIRSSEDEDLPIIERPKTCHERQSRLDLW